LEVYESAAERGSKQAWLNIADMHERGLIESTSPDTGAKIRAMAERGAWDEDEESGSGEGEEL
jgi:hypothetical protein